MNKSEPQLSQPQPNGDEPRLGGAGAIPHLLHIVAGNHLRRRWEAAFELEQFNEQVIPGVLPLLSDEQSGVRAVAVWLIGRVGDASHIQWLQQHLNDYHDAMPGMPGTKTVGDVAQEAIERLRQT